MFIQLSRRKFFRAASGLMIWGLLGWGSCHAATFYVDCDFGNNSNDGRSPAAAWESFTNISASNVSTGDSVLLKRGCSWRETLIAPASSVMISDYGSGTLPLIIGSDPITGTWTSAGGNVWQLSTAEVAGMWFFENGTTPETATDSDIHHGFKRAALGDLSQEYDFFWGADVLSVYSPNGDPSTAYSRLEQVNRYGAAIWDKTNVTLQNIETGFSSYGVFVNGESTGIQVQNMEANWNWTAGVYSQDSEVTIQDVTAHDNYAHGVFLYDANHNAKRKEVLGGHFYNHDTIESDDNFALRGGGVMAFFADNILVQGVETDHNAYGLKIAAERDMGTNPPPATCISTSNNVDFKSNNVHHNIFQGIDVDECSNTVTIEGNTISHTTNQGVHIEQGATGVTVLKNIFHNNVTSYTTTPPTYNNWYAGALNIQNVNGTSAHHNLFYDEYAAISINSGTVGNGSDNTEIYNNTIYDAQVGIKIANNSTGTNIRGNIFSNIGHHFYAVSSDSSSGFVSDYNIFYEESGTDDRFYWQKDEWEAAENYATWQGRGFDAHSFHIDPLLTDPANQDFVPQITSDAVDNGVNLGFTTDYNDTSVPQNELYDIGAHEVVFEEYTLAVTSPHATVTKSPNQATYTYGDEVTITLDVDDGYTFTGWTGDHSGSENPLTLTINSDTDLTANFTQNSYTLDVTSPHATVTKSPNQATYTYGDEVQIMLDVDDGYTFTGWTGDHSGSENPLTLTIDGDKNITANFSQNSYTLNVTSPHATVTKSPNQATYTYGDEVQITLDVDDGYTFTGWTGDHSGSENPLTLTINSDTDLTANFTQNSYTLDVTSPHATVTKSPNQATYTYGDEVQIMLDVDDGYTFTGWTGDHSGSENPLTLTIDGDKNITANFSQNSYTLNVTSPHATVTKSPNQATYTYGDEVQITLDVDDGYTFTGWTGDHSGSENPLTLTINSDTDLTANFTQNSYTLDVTSPHATVTKSPNQATYTYGDEVQIMLDVDDGYTFTGWTGDHSGSENPLTLTIDGDKNITANFSQNSYTLNVTSPHATVTKSPNQATYTYGDEVQITLDVDDGYTFTGWTGDHSGSENPLTLTINSDTDLTANFTQNSYTLDVTSPHATVTKSPNQATYTYGDEVQIMLDVDDGYTFTGWTGDHSGSENPLTLTIDGDKNITANFSQNSYTLNVTSPHATVTKSPNQATYTYGDEVQITLDVDDGYTFTGWTGDHSGSENPLTLTINSDTDLTANFTQNSYTLDVTSPHATVTKSPNQATYTYGDEVQIMLDVDDGYTFTGWTGDHSGSENPLTLTIDGDKNITANFSQNSYTLNVTSPHATVTKSPNQATYTYGDEVQITLDVDDGYTFTGWTGDHSGSENPLTLTINSDTDLTANFTQNSYTLDVTSPHATVTKSPNQATYTYGDEVQIMLDVDDGYTFTGWTGDHSGSENPLTLTINSDTDLTANFTQNSYTLNVTSPHATVTKSPNQATYTYGDEVQITLDVDDGYTFTGWTGDHSGSENPLTLTINSDTDLTANFTQNSYTLDVTSPHATVTKSPNQATYTYGDEVQIMLDVDDGYTFTGWTGDHSGSENPLTLTIDGDKNITANFSQNSYTLNVTSPHATVTKSPNQATYTYGDEVQITLDVDDGYTFTGWTGDHSGSENPLTLTINSDTDLTANFTQNSYTLDVTSPHATVTKSPNQATYTYGDEVQIMLDVDDGYTFTGWTGDHSGSENPLTLTINSDTDLTANFTQNSYTLTLIAPNGDISTSQAAPYHYGDTVTLTSTPNPDYHFVNWSGGLSGTQNPQTLTITTNITIIANFEADEPPPPEYTLSVTSVDGILTITPQKDLYTESEEVTLLATPKNGYTFDRWQGSFDSTDNPLTIVMTQNVNLEAIYTQNDYSVTTTTTGSGNIDTAPSKGDYHYGDTVTFTAEPSDGYYFVRWTGDYTGTENAFQKIITGDFAVEAVFSPYEYAIEIGTNHGQVVFDPQKTVYHYNDTVEITAIAEENYRFTSWNGDFSSTENPLTITIQGNVSLVATFAENDPLVCTENWICNDWLSCQPSGFRERTCQDLAGCGTEENKPSLLQECIYSITNPVTYTSSSSGSGKAKTLRWPGMERNDFSDTAQPVSKHNFEDVYEESFKQVQEMNEGFEGGVATYIKSDGTEGFGGYNSGRLSMEEIKVAPNRVTYRGTSKNSESENENNYASADLSIDRQIQQAKSTYQPQTIEEQKDTSNRGIRKTELLEEDVATHLRQREYKKEQGVPQWQYTKEDLTPSKLIRQQERESVTAVVKGKTSAVPSYMKKYLKELQDSILSVGKYLQSSLIWNVAEK